MFQQKHGQKCTWTQDTIDPRLMIDSVVKRSDLHPYVLDTEDRSCAVNWSPPGCELDQMAERMPERLRTPKLLLRVCWDHLAQAPVREINQLQNPGKPLLHPEGGWEH